jgi:hypothetical protein
MQYYGRLDDYPKSKTYGEILILGRWFYDAANELVLEKWDGEKWVDYPELLDATGAGGSTAWMPVSKEQAEAFLEGAGEEAD